MTDVTKLLKRLDDRDPSAADELLPLVYEELRRLAEARMAKESAGNSLQATALVHEAYLRLVDKDEPQCWSGRKHFFGAAAEAMRRILVDSARKKNAAKRSGKQIIIDLAELSAGTAEQSVEVIAIHEALDELEQRWPVHSELVKLRYFGGFKMAEAAEILEVSLATAERYWVFAKAWLFARLERELRL